MKTLKFLTVALVASSLFIGCSKDDDPQPVNEEEVITTMIVTLQPEGGGTEVKLQFRDLDGDGPDEPVFETNNLATGVTYSGSIVYLTKLKKKWKTLRKKWKRKT
mgnify:CR=1 FL=1